MSTEPISPATEVPFSLAEYADRQRRIRTAMAEAEIELLYLSAPESMCYATGYQARWHRTQSPTDWPPDGGIAIHVDHGEPIHFDDDSELALARFTSVARDIRVGAERTLLELVVKELRSSGWLPARVGLEMGSCRPNRLVSERFQAALEAAGCTVVDATAIVRGVRRLKSPAELQCVRAAQRVADVGMRAVIDKIAVGMTELDVYGELILAQARAGGENAGICQTVVSGAKSVCGHALPSRKVLAPGDIVNVDVAGVWNGYHANISRVFSMGRPVPAVAERIEAAHRAFDVMAGRIAPGSRVADLLEALESYYREADLWERQLYFGGYELGISFPPDWVGEWHWGFDTEPGEDRFDPGLVTNLEGNVHLPEGAGAACPVVTLMVTGDRAEQIGDIPLRLLVVD